MTETCEDAPPHIITHGETTAVPVDDWVATPRIHHALARKGVLPELYIVDTRYLDAELLATSQRDDGVNLLGPTRADCKWQAQAAQVFAASRCPIDWEPHQAICLQGRTRLS